MPKSGSKSSVREILPSPTKLLEFVDFRPTGLVFLLLKAAAGREQLTMFNGREQDL